MNEENQIGTAELPTQQVTDTPAQEAIQSVHDFEKAIEFVAHGLVSLGVSAKDELVALAKKYL